MAGVQDDTWQAWRLSSCGSTAPSSFFSPRLLVSYDGRRHSTTVGCAESGTVSSPGTYGPHHDHQLSVHRAGKAVALPPLGIINAPIPPPQSIHLHRQNKPAPDTVSSPPMPKKIPFAYPIPHEPPTRPPPSPPPNPKHQTPHTAHRETANRSKKNRSFDRGVIPRRPPRPSNLAVPHV
ncbi:hypothetical protein EJ06DRAFT_113311 [Trichodelitschia bisporula]|uniref:Uncharacterized protein n=1 Tax=Trichodelitschia bisporula TaxID=703511 RepID=A0A6G1HR75_9PEZI|nr:hypothetical protein EJ06DRAFT_113311 [Trichodelitschia bisporula]